MRLASREGARAILSDVVGAADALVAEGQSPTIRRLRERLGTGSDTTIHRHLKAYRAAKAPAERPATVVPDDVIRSISMALDRHAAAQSAETQQAAIEARDEADAIAETAERVEAERDEALERAEKAEVGQSEALARAEKAEAEVQRLTGERDKAQAALDDQRQALADTRAQAESAVSERDSFRKEVSGLMKEAAAAQELRDTLAWFQNRFDTNVSK